MKTASELSKLYRTIDLKSLSPTAKETLKKIVKANGNWKRKDEKAQQVFLDFYDKLKDKKPEFIKNTPEYRAKVLEAKKSNVLKARTAKNAKSQNQKQEDEGKGSERDARRPAKSPGWRLKGKHNYKKPTIADIRAKRAYFENRVNRADKKRKKFPMLEKGGYMEKGGSKNYVAVSEKDGYWYIISKPSTKENAQKQIDLGVPKGEVGKVVTLQQAKEHKKVIGKEYLILEKGGYMAKGGVTNYVAVSEKDGYWYILSKPSTKANAQKIIDLGVPKGEVGKVVTLQQAKEYKKVIGKEYLTLEKGGYMAKGGKTPFEKLSDKVAKNYQGDKVPKKYQSLYGKTYDKSEAKEVGDKVAAKVYRLQLKNKKMKSGGEILYTEKHRKD
jgi:hypothetical protein